MARIVRAPRIAALALVVVIVTALTASAAGACGSLVAANGAVNLVRTSTLAAYHDGVEHYMHQLRVHRRAAGAFGSIVPLPANPTTVERGGRLDAAATSSARWPRSTSLAAETFSAATAAGDRVQVLREVRIESLDITILRGGGKAVAKWAEDAGLRPHPWTAPQVFDFYAKRSPYFMAAKFDASAAVAQGFPRWRWHPGAPRHPDRRPVGPVAHPRARRRVPQAQVNADVFLLTDHKPSLLYGKGLRRTCRASRFHHLARRPAFRQALVVGARATRGSPMDRSSGRADEVLADLAIDVHGEAPKLARHRGDEPRRARTRRGASCRARPIRDLDRRGDPGRRPRARRRGCGGPPAGAVTSEHVDT